MGKKMDIEEQFRQAIRQAGMNRHRLAKVAGVSEAVLSLFNSGQRSMTLRTASRLAKTLGLELRPKTAKRARKAARHG
jgi:ribosome-binding protein aMBF1 (putative translation factor)